MSLQRCCSVTTVLTAVALLPVDPVLEDAPVTDARHSGVGDGGAPSEDLSPPSVPDEASRSLLDDLDPEGSGRVALVTVALHGGVPLLLEGPVHPAPVLEPVLGELVFGPDSCDLLLVFCRGTLIAFDGLA